VLPSVVHPLVRLVGRHRSHAPGRVYVYEWLGYELPT
jgi:hypothetical protein